MSKKRRGSPRPGGNRRGAPCDCGDPKCTKMVEFDKLGKRRARQLSGMARVDPIVKDQPVPPSIKAQQKAHPGAIPVRFDDDGNIVGDYAPGFLKKVKKDLDGWSRSGIYSLGLGLPSRIRRYVKKVWKLQDKRNADWGRVADEMAPTAAKILDNRIEVVAITGIVVSREGRFSDERLMKLAEALSEADALLTIYSHFFLPGITAHLAQQCSLLAQGGKRGYILGGVVDVVDFGRYVSVGRRRRRVEAENDMNTNGWKMPRRDY